MASPTKKTRKQGEKTAQDRAQAAAFTDGLRARDSRRQGGALRDTYFAELRRLQPGKAARELMNHTPGLGADSLEALHKMAWGVMAESMESYRTFCQALKDCNPEEDGLGNVDVAELRMKAAQKHAEVLKKVMDVSVSLNRLWLDRDLETAGEGMQIGVDEWEADILQALVQQADGTVH